MSVDDLKKIAARQLFYELNQQESHEIAKQRVDQKISHEPQYNFTKVYKIPVRRLIVEGILTTAEKAFLFDIIPFVNRDTNIIVDDRGFPMGQQKLLDMCRMGRTKLSEVTNGLIDKGILTPEIEEGKKYYRVNREYIECKRKEFIDVRI